jgi:P27 family predicted phage terminase small subunit
MGVPVSNPYVVLANQALKRVKSFLTEFGMTPSSRSRIMAVPDDNEDDEWKDL